MKNVFKAAIICSFSMLATSLGATSLFDTASMTGLPDSTLPGFSSPLTFTSSSSASVTPNVAFNVGMISQTLTNPGPADEPGTNGYNSTSGITTAVDTPVNLAVTYTINGTQYTGAFSGDLVQDGWSKSITSDQYFAYDYVQFTGGTVVNGEDIVPLGNSGYNVEISSSNMVVGKGNPFNVTVMNSAPEPATWGAMGLGLIVCAWFGLWRRKTQNQTI